MGFKKVELQPGAVNSQSDVLAIYLSGAFRCGKIQYQEGKTSAMVLEKELLLHIIMERVIKKKILGLGNILILSPNSNL